MTKEFLATQDYRTFITQIKQSIKQARNNAIRSVNSELIGLYYKIGKQIVQKQKNSNWGEDLIGQIELDLKTAFPDLRGFSRANLFYMRNFFLFFGEAEFVPQLVGQIPWGHIRLILDKIKDYAEAEFYVQKTIENSWSRVILDHQIDLKLYQRQGKIISNFKTTVDAQEVALIQEAFKESYVLDFLELGADAKSIYKNQKFNFSFSYPANLIYVDTEPSLALQKSEIITDTSIGHNVWGVTIAKDAKAEIVNDGISIEVRKRENKSANAFPASLQGDQGPTPIKREETTVGGIYAMHYIDSDLIYTSHGDVQGVNETYVVEKDGYVYTISSFGTNAEYWDALTGIVQSFRF